MSGPYPFLMVRHQSIGISIFWITSILAIAYTVAKLLLVFNQKNLAQLVKRKHMHPSDNYSKD
ncbi:hypothetical protein [Enterococcus camelliae]|uniref:hypothetical protein n=1 Tax=Enterococcus camelliae TaxID=453959 RepID=UPI0036D24D85